MIELRKVRADKTQSSDAALFVDGKALPSARVYKDYDKKGMWTVSISVQGNDANVIGAKSFSDLPPEISSLTLQAFSPTTRNAKLRHRFNVKRIGSDTLVVSIICSFNVRRWNHLWSIQEYIDEFRLLVEREHPYGTEWGDKPRPVVTPAFDILFPFADLKMTIKAAALKCEAVVAELHKFTESSLKTKLDNPEAERIIRSIEFPPEYHRSGVSILSYFADVLRHKNLSEDVKVSIEQNGLNVSLVIESPTGQRELVEKTLEAYALVVTGRQPIETLTTDPYQVAELRHELRSAKDRIETQRDLLAAKNAEVSDLRTEVKETRASLRRLERRADEDRARFMKKFEALVSHNMSLSAGFMELAQRAQQAHNSALAGALENLYKVVERGVREEDREEVIENLTTIQREDPSVFSRVSDILLTGALSNAAGNYMYSWLQFLVGSLPK